MAWNKKLPNAVAKNDHMFSRRQKGCNYDVHGDRDTYDHSLQLH